MENGSDLAEFLRAVDVFSTEYVNDPAATWDALRAECPMAHTPLNGGGWLPTTFDDIAAIAYDTEHFSSRDTGVAPTPEGVNLLTTPPITSDPPFHTDARRILLPFFSPKPVAEIEGRTRSIATELLDALEGEEFADAAGAYAQHIPVRVIAAMLGLPESDEEQFTQWTVDLLQSLPSEYERRAAGARAMLNYFREKVELRRQEPSEDLISQLLATTMVNGDPLTERHIVGTCFLLLVAGIDTTWSSIGASLFHLASNRADRERLVAEPELLPTAIEEFLRAYAPVTMARETVSDTEVAGCAVSAGQKVFLPFGAGNRDPSKFDRADEVLIDREENRHFAFGIGIHRCLGSNLARMELRVALEEWLARFPDFELAPDAQVEWGGTQVRGPRAVPVVLRSHG
jgi:cytochrome P450